ncbi:MAG: hypothetical protein V8S27_05470 [Lachnospiraceae bacterium]
MKCANSYLSRRSVCISRCVFQEPDVDAIYLDAVGFEPETWLDCVVSCHMMGKSCYRLLPHIFRTEAEAYFRAHGEELREARFMEWFCAPR